MRAWSARLGIAVGVWLAITTVAYVFGSQPRPGLLALMVAAGAAVIWLYVDVTADSETARWLSPRDEPLRPPGEDPRLAQLTRVVAQHLDAREAGVALHRHLAAVADQTLVARHGISHRADPDRAAGLLGPELTEVMEVAAGRAPARRLDLRRIDLIVTRIEDL